jgi:competence protein ComGC
VIIVIVGITTGIFVPILMRNLSEASSNGNNGDLDSRAQCVETIKKLELVSSLDELNSEGSPYHSALMCIVEEDIQSPIDGGNNEKE